MKAVYLNEHGGIDVLRYGDLPDPVPAANDVLVRVKACGVNHIDLWTRQGLPFITVPFPFVLGTDVAGEVAAVGSDVHSPLIGKKVVINPGVSCNRCERCLSGKDHQCAAYTLMGEHFHGGNAQLLKIPVENLVPLPDGLRWEDAAAVPVVFITAWNMLFDTGRLQPGEWVLIQAGSSGVSSAAIQLARLAGARIITTVGSEEKMERAQALGAHHVINYQKQDFLREVHRITKRQGVNMVIEHVGQSVWERSLACLTNGGRLVTCGATSGYEAKTDLRRVFFRQLQILGATAASKGVLFKIVQLLKDGDIHPVLDRVLPLADAPQAHRILEDRKQFGKIVLIPE